jgi:hypothetical protein
MEGVAVGAGDECGAEFAAFFAEHHRALGRLAYRRLGRAHAAEEVTADAFADVWRRWDELSGGGGGSGSSEAAAVAALYEAVGRIATERVSASARHRLAAGYGEPQAPYEPNGTHIRALLSERLALIPPHRTAPAAVQETDAFGAAVSFDETATDEQGRHARGGPRRSKRPGPVATVIGANALAAFIAVAVAMCSGPASPAGDSTIVTTGQSVGAGGAMGFGSASPSASATWMTPSPSPSASPSHSPTAVRTTPPPPGASAMGNGPAPSARPAPTTPLTSAAPPPAPNPPNLVTVVAGVNPASNASWPALEVATFIHQTLDALTITIHIAPCPGLSAEANWNSGASGEFAERTSIFGDGSITYVFSLIPGQLASTGEVGFNAQFTHSGRGWNASADTYSVAATAAGTAASQKVEGRF